MWYYYAKRKCINFQGLWEKYLEIYKNSLENDEEIEKAERLITYFRNNRVRCFAPLTGYTGMIKGN